jgi:hypothetical protein
MSQRSKIEYLNQIRYRYKNSTKQEKIKILDEFCAVCNYNRKYAIQLLNAEADKRPKRTSKRGAKKQYDHPVILEVLIHLWKSTNLPCSKRLKAIIPTWLPFCEHQFAMTDEVRAKLLRISAATIDRLMQKYRRRFSKQGLATTKPGSILKKHIPIKTNQWDESVPGFVEADTVAHCGTSTEGSFVFTINCVDIATSWTEQRATWGKGKQGIIDAISSIENNLPFPLNGFDCDNGSEFLNWHLYRKFVDRDKPVQFTRSRPYYKNDNAHIEQKNWTNIRQYLGYQRFDKHELVPLLNNLYTTEWNYYFNFFIPSIKLIEKKRDGSKIIKRYDKPKTPYQRIFESPHISEQSKAELKALFETLNPFELQERMSNKIKTIIKLVSR